MYQEILSLLSCPCCKKDFTCFPAEKENEKIAEGEEADLLPRPGSWFANTVITAVK